MNKEMTSIDIDRVIVKESLRDRPGDLTDLESSIKRIGLLHPIIIDRRNVLLVGARRLAACRNAGMTSVPAIRTSIEYGSMESLEIQADENLCREPLSPAELEKHIGRKKAALDGPRNGGMMAGLKRMLRGAKDQ